MYVCMYVCMYVFACSCCMDCTKKLTFNMSTVLFMFRMFRLSKNFPFLFQSEQDILSKYSAGQIRGKIGNTGEKGSSTLSQKLNPASILYKSIAGRYRPVSYPDGPITARYRFIKNAFLQCLNLL